MRGDDVLAWLRDPTHREIWQALYVACPWRNPYQSYEFVETWYRHYQHAYEPLLILGLDANARVRAIAPLCVESHAITGAGAAQAEYQGFLCRSETVAPFLNQLLALVAEVFPTYTLRLRYLLPSLLTSIHQAGLTKHGLEIDSCERPLLALEREPLQASLKKKGTRSKRNRLARIGAVAVTHVEQPSADLQRFDEMVHIYDLRQAAENDTAPFLEDTNKRGFQIEWMARAAQQFFVVNMFAGTRLVAALIGVRAESTVHNAIFCFDPLLAQHSPGKLLIHEAGLLMLDAGVHTLDLTPGGDAWKARFSTHHDRVGELEYRCGWVRPMLQAVSEQLIDTSRRVIQRSPLTTRQLRDGLALIRRVRPTAVANRVRRLGEKRREFRVYRINPQHAPSGTLTRAASVDEVSDMLYFRPDEPWQRRQLILQAALQRLVGGEKLYTQRDGDRLAHYGWVVPLQSQAHFTEVAKSYHFPQPGAVLYDFYTAAYARGRGLYQATLSQMLHELATEGRDLAYIGVLADNGASRHVIEKAGFEYVQSVFEDE